MNPQRPQRPVGVLLSALALGLTALFLILFSFGSLLGAAANQRLGVAAAGMPQSPAVTAAVMLVMTFFYIALAGWSIATLVGLLRMRSWARVSTMVIAGGLAALGLLSAVAMLGMQSLFAAGNVPLPPNVPPALLHKLIVIMAAASLVVATLGIAWLVYLAQRRTRDAFAIADAHHRARQMSAWPPPPGQPAPAPPPSRAIAWPPPQPAAPNPLTDFTVARPIESPPAAAPAQPYPASEWAPWNPQGAQQPGPWPIIPVTRVRSGRPASITVLAIFALISAFFSLFGVVSPVPAFLFGAVVSGWPVHLYSLVWAAAMAIAGLGMLRLQRPAWLLSFVLLGISSLHALVMLLPAARARYAAYLLSLQQSSGFGGSSAALPAGMVAASAAVGMVFGLALLAVFAVLLWRARWAFEPAPTPAPEETPQP